ncbi:MAG: Rieske (2Fe-2S) protein [Chloroflexi bacterium]|nr:Rieske (2Fe-2S) protein [Chloroflexota bacterium]MDL1883805.1 Rieske (2Fe-2S) protein [Anaerolineae bacterium CFX8]
MVIRTDTYILAARLDEVREKAALAVQVEGHTLVLFAYGERVYAVDNRCPHMSFPLDRGSVRDGILTCHWHHARFDLASGGSFDQWADDVRTFPVDIRDGDVWVDVSPPRDPRAHQRQRLRDGLERNIPLVLAKAVIALLDGGEDPAAPFRAGLDFGTHYRWAGWGQGLTILTCLMNLLPYLTPEDRPRALYHGLSAAANDSDGAGARFIVQPLPTQDADIPTLKRWFRQFIEVRDAEGAERCIVAAVRSGADHRQMADMLFAAATDHRYIQTGHVLDFANKALEALDIAGWEYAEMALTSLANAFANADRMEEANEWRHPVDLVAILEQTFEELPRVLEYRRLRHGGAFERDTLVKVLLGENPQAIAAALLDALREGCSEVELAGAVSYAAALRIARFHTSNEFSDWDTALHTFTFANAVEQGLRRVNSPELLRGVFDAAMSVYLDRFLNVPPARLPQADEPTPQSEALLDELAALLNRQHQVNEAGWLAARYLYAGGDPDRLLALLGRLLLREDRDFHTIQTIEAAFRQYDHLRGTPAGTHVLIAAARYLAAHAPTMRAQGQTYQIAWRLSRGEKLFEE